MIHVETPFLPCCVMYWSFPAIVCWCVAAAERQILEYDLLSALLKVIQSSNHLSFSSNSVLTVQRGCCQAFGVQEVFICNLGRQTAGPGLQIKMTHGTWPTPWQFPVKLQLYIITNLCRIQHRETYVVDLDLVPLVMQAAENIVLSIRLQTFALSYSIPILAKFLGYFGCGCRSLSICVCSYRHRIIK